MLAQRLWDVARARRRRGTSGPTTRTRGPCAGSSIASATPWASRSPGTSDEGATAARGALPEGRLLEGAGPARLDAALGPRPRRSRASRSWYRDRAVGRRSAPSTPCDQIAAFQAERHPRRASHERRRPAASAAPRSTHVFADLGMSPLANSFLSEERAGPDGAVLPAPGARLPRMLPRPARGARDPGRHLLRLRLLLVVLDHLARPLPALRGDGGRALRARRALQVVELASNDGYLLQYFVERGVPVLGIEPAANVAEVAAGEGHPDDGRSSSGAPPRARSRP